MSTSTIGRRYERLLFWAGPLAVLCILVLFVAVASDQQEERRRANCLRLSATALQQNATDLDNVFAGQEVKFPSGSTADYWLALRYVLIPVEVRGECRGRLKEMSPSSIKEWKVPPEKLASNYKAQAEALEKTPISLYGIEMPEKSTINIFGTQITMRVETLVRVMQFALGPVLLLWLGSLYHTRHRETLMIARIPDLTQLYPHLINVYPVLLFEKNGRMLELRRKSWIAYSFERFALPAWFALVRSSLLSVFVGPPVAAYLMSLVLVHSADFAAIFIGIGFFVFLFATAVLLVEIFPWHFGRRFRVAI